MYCCKMAVVKCMDKLQYTIEGCFEPNMRNFFETETGIVPVEASTVPHVGQHGSHQLYYYYYYYIFYKLKRY